MIALALAASLITTPGDIVIRHDNGGEVDRHLFMKVPGAGQRLVIDGPCFSACTILLETVAMSPSPNVGFACVTPRALLFYHASRDERGRWTDDAAENYRPEVAAWVLLAGGFHKSPGAMTLMPFRAARQFYNVCDSGWPADHRRE